MDLKHETPKEAMGGHDAPAPRPVIPPGDVAYEKTDVNAKSIIRIAIVLAVVTIGAAGVAFGLFRMLVAHEERNDPPPPPLARDEGRLAPGPRLQTAPAAELAAVQEEDRRALAGYGWADQAGGIARIPIEEAMALYVDQAQRAAALPAPSMMPSPSAMPSLAPSPAQGHP